MHNRCNSSESHSQDLKYILFVDRYLAMRCVFSDCITGLTQANMERNILHVCSLVKVVVRRAL